MRTNARKFRLALTVLMLVALLLAVFGAVPVWAQTNRYVDPTGADAGDCSNPATPCLTITYAIGQAVAGDTINVAAGIYQEDLTINKELTLQGAGRTTTTILRNASTDTVFLIQADNVKINGFKIDGGGSYPYPVDHMVSLSTAGTTPHENIEVSDCHLLHSKGAAIWFNGDPPGGLAIGTGYKINDNTIEYFAGDACTTGGCQYRGIAVGKTLGLEIKRNTITNSNPWEYKLDNFTYGGYAIYLKDYTGGTVEQNTISKCLYGIVVNSNVAETYVNNNTITECHRGIVTGESFAKIHITNNSVTTRRDPGNPAHAKNVNEQGILLGGDGDWYDSSPPYDWQVDNLQHQVSGNTVTGTSTTDSFGIGVMPGWWDKDYGASGTVTDNTVSGYKNGLKVWGTYAPWDGSTEDMTNHVHTSFGFNNIVDCTTDAAVDGIWSGAVGGIDAENNWWGSDAGPDNISDKYDYDPWLDAPVADSTTEDVGGTGGTIPAGDSPTGGAVTVSGTGIPAGTTVTSAQYTGNPGGDHAFKATGYYDVHLDDTTGVASLTVEFCPATEDTVIYYWNGTDWVACSNQVFNPGTGCVVVTITADTDPDLDYLTGGPFASGYTPEPVGGYIVPVNRLGLLAPWLGLVALAGLGFALVRRRRSV